MEFNFKLPIPTDQTSSKMMDTPTPPPENKTSHSTRDPHRRACEYEPGYNWRTDPYYDEDAIRERLKAAKAAVLPTSANDRKERPQ